jgi:hypothetical protein
LIFPRRKARTKKGKDLYYIFDLLVYRDDFRDKIVSDLGNLREHYRPWFKTFAKNIGTAFIDIHSDAVAMTVEQRLTDNQLKQFVLSTFQEFLSLI